MKRNINFNNKKNRTYSKNIKNIQKYQKISQKLRRINDFLDFQEYSIDGKEFIINREEYLNSSFFSENNRYFAMINCDSCEKNKNKLNIRK